MKAEYTIGAVVSGIVVSGLLFLFLVSPSPAAPTAASGAQAPEAALSPALAGAPTQGSASAPGTKGVPYAEITDPSGFVNTGTNADGSPKPITIKQFIGKKVILVDFLTYSCINCQRTFPYLNAWYEKYKDQGLEIIGIHTPEFAFEKDINNVRAAMQKFGITHPIVLDNNYGTWNAYGNQYWPRKYLIDIHGNIVYDHVGEGAYDETEMKIKELLAERAKALGTDMPADGSLAASAVPAVSTAAGSPETYFGSARNQYLANGASGTAGKQTLSLPQTPAPNKLYLGGTWDISSEYAAPEDGASVLYRYNAKNVYLVASAAAPVNVDVLQDGALVRTVTIAASTLYPLIEDAAAGEHTLLLRVKGTGLKLYTFTFG